MYCSNSHHAVIVLSANAHISSCDGYVSYFRKITEGCPFIGSVCIWLAGLLFCFPHVIHEVIPEVSVCLRLGKEAELIKKSTPAELLITNMTLHFDKPSD